MIQTLAPAVNSLNSQNCIQFLCCYVNATSRIQRVRVTDINHTLQLEKIVFSGQRMLFEALQEFQLEIYTDIAGRENLLEKIPCHNLRTLE